MVELSYIVLFKVIPGLDMQDGGLLNDEDDDPSEAPGKFCTYSILLDVTQPNNL